jgi:hypothetical protein
MPEVSFGSANLTICEVVLPNGLVVREIRAETGRWSGSVPPSDPADLPEIKLEADLDQLGIANFLAKESPGNLKDFEVALQDERLYIKATARIILEARGVLVCRLEVVEGRQIWVRLEDVQFLGLRPNALVESQLEKINPVLDLADLPVDGRIESVSIAAGKVTVHLVGMVRL